MARALHPPRALLVRELALPLLALLVVAVLPLLVWSRLPDPIAVHWGVDGLPDGSAPVVVDAVLMAVAAALVAFLPPLAAARGDRGTARAMLALSHGMAALLVLLRWSTLERNLDATVWTEAGTTSLLDVVLLLLLAAPFALIGWWLGGRHPDLPRPIRAVLPFQLPLDGHLLWTGRQAWPFARVLGSVLVAGGAAITATRYAAGTMAAGGTLILIGLLLWMTTSIAVSTGPAGLKVRFGPLGWPAIHVPLAEIDGIEVEDVEPLAYGGWGYRVTPGVRAVVIRRGSGLRVRRTGRADLVVTVDDAATAAGVLAAHLADHRRGEQGP